MEGLRELRRDLKKLSPEANKQLGRELRKPAQMIAVTARGQARRKSGRYARSIRVYASKGGFAVGSNLPQAGVLHWGGTIRPRGVPIVFKPEPVVIDAASRHEKELLEAAGNAVETAARKAGFK